MRNFSYEIYDSKGARIVVEDYFKTIKKAKISMMKEMKNLEDESSSVVYRRYVDGEWGNYQKFTKKENKIIKLTDTDYKSVRNDSTSLQEKECEMEPAGTIATGHGITMFRLLAIKARFKLEIKGMNGSGQTMYSLVKERYGFKGNRQKVYEQFCQYIEEEAKKLKAGDIQTTYAE